MSDQVVGPPAVGVTEIEVEGCISVYAPATSDVLLLNESASDVWRLADGTMTVGAIVQALASSYSIEPAAIFDDVTATIARFRRAQVLASE